jgi:hypothetical protein
LAANVTVYTLGGGGGAVVDGSVDGGVVDVVTTTPRGTPVGVVVVAGRVVELGRCAVVVLVDGARRGVVDVVAIPARAGDCCRVDGGAVVDGIGEGTVDPRLVVGVVVVATAVVEGGRGRVTPLGSVRRSRRRPAKSATKSTIAAHTIAPDRHSCRR